MAEKELKGFIRNPQNREEFVHNAQFQLANVEGWMICSNYRSALIKAECLVSDLKLLLDAEAKDSVPVKLVITDSILQSLLKR